VNILENFWKSACLRIQKLIHLKWPSMILAWLLNTNPVPIGASSCLSLAEHVSGDDFKWLQYIYSKRLEIK